MSHMELRGRAPRGARSSRGPRAQVPAARNPALLRVRHRWAVLSGHGQVGQRGSRRDKNSWGAGGTTSRKQSPAWQTRWGLPPSLRALDGDRGRGTGDRDFSSAHGLLTKCVSEQEGRRLQAFTAPETPRGQAPGGNQTQVSLFCSVKFLPRPP